jgi:hypothetical protein
MPNVPTCPAVASDVSGMGPCQCNDATLQKHVDEALNNALENGYDFDGWTTLQIAVDLCRCDVECEKYEPEMIADYVNSWRECR